ncbi:O-antigen ligase domain-containing protein [Leptospira gomenensis]|uniref:O-antigen ligase domain-containing protein n=1 Tax=Leptospira gomenensis TaxID=2484974 RepID=A0A5F1YGJ8_9LEPT|nr:O-antigen ligase family protein [Leptospira gomenensis]TGK31538.1 O-antigen ligase domain-containing protein [Leptospira gomenensis]TGK44188.1 O-antigen ligase domain-containing protein [Leptospira gomenensis]TGK46243.1 O-antigen ligase domain-containing protein [Leptospira gomenensis]TGK54768.1 O-antigen ligase domain-containing protein [Leptospira gomenensis]
MAFALLLILPLFDFYPWKFRIGFSVFFLLFAVLDFFSPIAATFLLAASGPFFGNHPGGRFLELQDCLWIFWSVRGTAEAFRSKLLGNLFFPGEWKTNPSPSPFLLFAFFGAGSLSLAVNPELIADWTYFRKSWFGFLHSTELEPFYPFKVLGTGLLFSFGFLSRTVWMRSIGKESRFTFWFGFGVSFGFLFSVVIGWSEYFFPTVKSLLDAYHIWLDGYKLTAPPHLILPFSDRILPNTAIQSLFWNRSWFAVYLVASFPFLFETLFSFFRTEGFRSFFSRPFVKSALLFSVLAGTGITFVWIGARGAFLAFAALVCGTSIHFVYSKIRIDPNLRKRISFLSAAAIVSVAILFPLFVLYVSKEADPERFVQFRTGFRIGIDKLLLGGGFESFGWFNECCADSNGRAAGYHTSHNQWIQVFSGTGLVGVLFFSFLWGFFLYERLQEGTRNGSVLRASFLFGSMFAVLVYSFFQEWFYLRSVYFLWIVCFLSFSGSGQAASDFSFFFSEKRSEFQKRFAEFGGVAPFFVSILFVLLLFCSVFFFPTNRYRYGIYQPPAAKDPSELWILEGNGSWPVFSGKKGIRADFEAFADADFFSAEWNRRKTVKTGLSRGEVWTDSFYADEFDKMNILKTECILREDEFFPDLSLFWKREISDPETRKFCVRIRISPGF